MNCEKPVRNISPLTVLPCVRPAYGRHDLAGLGGHRELVQAGSLVGHRRPADALQGERLKVQAEVADVVAAAVHCVGPEIEANVRRNCLYHKLKEKMKCKGKKIKISLLSSLFLLLRHTVVPPMHLIGSFLFSILCKTF